MSANGMSILLFLRNNGMKIKRLWSILLTGALLTLSCQEKQPASELPPPSKPEPGAHKGPTAVFIGDSITWQWGLVTRQLKESQKVIIPTDPAPAWMSISGSNVVITWHASFFTNNDYVDKGVSGQNTSEMVARYQTDVLAQDPWCVVIMGGTNDLAQGVSQSQIMTNIKSMAEQAAAKDMKVVLCSVTPCNMSYSKLSPKEKGTHIVALNKKIKEYADEKGFAYCDYHKDLVAANGLSLKAEYCLYDALHPNPDAYTVMEGIIRPIIRKLLAK